MNAGDDYLAELGNRPAARPPASIGEIWSAEWTRSGLDTIGGLGHPLAEASDDLAQAVSVAAGKDWREYAEEKGTPLASISPFAEDRIGLLNRLADTLPEEKQKELAPLRDVHARAADKAQKIERNASDVAAGAYGLSGIATSFLAGIARQSVDPANLIAGAATAPLGGPFAGSAVKVIARQAAAGGLAQAAVEPYIVSARQELGLETHALEDIGQAALGAAGIAGIFRAGAWGMRVAGRAARGEELFPPKPAGPTAGQQVADLLRSYTPDRLQGALDRVIGPAELDAAATLADRDRLIAQATAGQAQGELRLRETIAALEEGRPPPLGVAQVDNLYRQALDLVRTEKNASTSFVQRKLGLDYNDAVAIMTRLEREGVIGPADRHGARSVLEQKTPAAAGSTIAPGSTQDLIRPNGGRITVAPHIVELGDLVVSHDLAGNPNPNYPPALQPRDRSAPASRTWIAEKAAALEPELLGEAPTAGLGAPVIGPDNVVESGNGRALLLAQAYAKHPGRAGAYRKFLEAQGHDISGFKEPVLVRVRQGELAIEERAAFAREANVAPVAGLSTRERAFADAKGIDANLMAAYRGGSVLSAENAPFVRAFADRLVAPEERPQFIGGDDRLSAEGARRIEAAIVAKAWSAPDIVTALYESADPTSKAILGAMADTAPSVARLAAAVAEKRVPADASPIAALLDAFRLVERARAGGLRVGDLAAQVDLEHGAVSTAVIDAAKLFFRDDAMRVAAGREVVAARIDKAVTRALEHENALGDLFGVKPTAENALRAGALAGLELGDQPLFAGASGVVRRDALDPTTFARQRAELTAAQPFATLDEAIARAPAAQAELVSALEEAAGKESVRDPGVKLDRARMAWKVEHKYKGDLRSLTDITRAGVVVNMPADAEPIVAKLSARYRIIDEGWNVTPEGYFDRKIEVILPDGTMTEVQFWPPEVYAAKIGEGHRLYEQARAAPAHEQAQWEKRQKAFWSEVQARVDAAWREVIGGSPKEAKSSANDLRAAASESGRASVSESISAGETGSQPLAPADQARPSSATAATVVPQENQRVAIEPSTANVSGAAAARNDKNITVNQIGDPVLAREYERVLAELGGDIELTMPDGTKISARAALEDARADARAAAELEDCIGAAAA
jgi:hypothetical protein